VGTAELRRLDVSSRRGARGLVNAALRAETGSASAAARRVDPRRLAALAELAQSQAGSMATPARSGPAGPRTGWVCGPPAGPATRRWSGTCRQRGPGSHDRSGRSPWPRQCRRGGPRGSATARALGRCKRVAHAAALLGDARRCEAGDHGRREGLRPPPARPRPALDYWLTDDEFAAMTGAASRSCAGRGWPSRCSAMRWPASASPARALYRGWLAEAHLTAGAPDAAAPLAARALL
jgi:hypothetical protein